VIGIGNELRQDDGAGVAVARRLRRQAAGLIEVIEHDGEATSLLQAWDGARVVILVDAVRSGSTPGTIHRIDVRSTDLPKGATWSSSHSLGLAEAVALGDRLACLPDALVIYGIEGKCFGFGPGLSTEVDKAASTVVETLLQGLRRSG
jgi:hydrogenase maturation protease